MQLYDHFRPQKEVKMRIVMKIHVSKAKRIGAACFFSRDAKFDNSTIKNTFLKSKTTYLEIVLSLL